MIHNTKTLYCDQKGCKAAVVVESGDDIKDITIINKARDEKWRLINGREHCPACFEKVSATLRDIGFKVDANGKLT
jgi:uncharacterized protein with PIN domain